MKTNMLLAQIKQDQLSARKNKETVKSSLLTTLIGDIENLIKTKNSDNTDTLIIGLIKSYLDKNLEFQNSHPNSDVLRSLKQEQTILQQYMPSSLSDDEIKQIITQNSLTSMPNVMKHFKENYFGKYDGKKLSDLAKSIFNV